MPEPAGVDERERLIVENLPLVRLIARRIHERIPENPEFDDLVSAGVLGLIQAVDNYDPSHNASLTRYAEFRIRGAILDSLRSTDWAPRKRRHEAQELADALDAAARRLGRTPGEEDVAQQLGVTLEQYRDRLLAIAGLEMGELDLLDDDSGLPETYRYVSDPEENSPVIHLERAELSRLIATAIDRIPATERIVLSLYYHEELTLREISQVMGLHLTRISQIKSQAILRLRSAIRLRWPGTRG